MDKLKKELDKIFDMMPTEKAFYDNEAETGGYEKIEARLAIERLIQTAISKAKAEERKRIKKQCLKETLMGGFNYHWHYGKDWIDRKQLIRFLSSSEKNK